MSKNSPPDNFKRLDQAELKVSISDWAKDYLCIENISLYRMKRDKDFPNDPKYVFVVDEPNLPTKSDRDTEKSYTELEPSLIKYYKETHENCSHIYHLMEDFYRIGMRPDKYQEEWLWFTMNKEDGRIEDYEMVMDVEPLVLYERDDQPCSAASAVVASPAAPSSAEGRISENANASSCEQIEGEKLINHLGIAPFVLVEYMKQGLSAYTRDGKKVYDKVYDDLQFDLPAYLADHGIEVVKTMRRGANILYCLKHCIKDHSHVNNDAAIGQDADGIPFYQCLHNSCKGVTWHEVHQKIDPETKKKPTIQERMAADRRWALHQNSLDRGQEGISADISPDPPGWYGINLSLPQARKMADEIIEDILTFYFSVDDYEEFAKKHALESLINLTDPDINNNTPVLEFLSEEHTLYKDDIIEVDTSKESVRSKAETDNKNSLNIPCPPGTKWNDIKITLIDHDTVHIKTPYNSGQFTYRELGMSFIKNANRPKKIWQILKLFARYNGRLDSEIPDPAKRILYNDYGINYNEKLPDYTKRLNKHLKTIFGIKDSIFKYHYTKYKAYITKIKFSDQRHIEKPDLDDPAIKSLHDIEIEDIQNKHGISDSQRFVN